MSIYKNVSGQKVAIFAWDSLKDTPKDGNSAQITAQISKDGGTTASTNDVNPTELDSTDAPGIYIFDLTQSETNADMIVLFAKSSTTGIIIDPIIIYTVPGDSSGFGLSATEVKAEVDSAFTTQMADSIPSDGQIPTREQAMYIITQFLTERVVSGTSLLIKKVDGSTTLMTLTLDDADAPTSVTRTS